MRITVLFRFNHEEAPVAVTGIEGEISDMLMPSVGDLVEHSDSAGAPFTGKVTDRIFKYDLPAGVAVNGVVSVTLCLDRTVVH